MPKYVWDLPYFRHTSKQVRCEMVKQNIIKSVSMQKPNMFIHAKDNAS